MQTAIRVLGRLVAVRLRLQQFRRHSAFTRANGGTALGDRPLPVPPDDDAEYARQLDEAGRVLLRITPERVLIND